MPVTLTFTKPLNISLQIGDTAYYVPTVATGGFNVNSSSIIEIGIVSAIGGTIANPTITIALNLVVPPAGNLFILFSKNNKVNMSSALGYYAEVKFKNSSTVEAELFSIGADIFESSK
tara:strand:- start:153 stop:506 length:354 start_codon:yes stop_codon:yes gene_type:complete